MVRHFHQHVHRCLLQLRDALEVLKPLDHVDVYCCSLDGCAFRLEPGVVECLPSRKPVVWAHLQQFPDEVFNLLTDLLELRVIEVELAVLDLVENFVPVFALEWQVAAHENVEKHSEGPGVAL